MTSREVRKMPKSVTSRVAPLDNKRDAYLLINQIVRGMTGIDSTLQVYDTSSFLAVGATILKCGTESLLKAMSDLVGRTIFSARPYKGKFDIMRVFYQRWGAITRKIVYLSHETESTDFYNTLDGSPLENGKSVDMYEINNPGVVQLSFYKMLTLQMHTTIFSFQLNTALSGEDQFMQFWDAYMVNLDNDVESINEARRRMIALNAIAAANQMGQVVDLAESYNAKFGTNYSRNQLLTSNLKSFMMHSVAEIKKRSKAMTDRNNRDIVNIEVLENAGKHILRHTPISLQRLLIYSPAMIDQEAFVLPELFGPQYLSYMRHEEVNYWQYADQPSMVKIKPAIMDSASGEQIEGEEQTIDYVFAYLYDMEHMGSVEHYQGSSVTPYNSAGRYYNIYYDWLFGGWNDFTEKHILFIVGPGGAGEENIVDVNVRNTTLPISGSVTVVNPAETVETVETVEEV